MKEINSQKLGDAASVALLIAAGAIIIMAHGIDGDRQKYRNMAYYSHRRAKISFYWSIATSVILIAFVIFALLRYFFQ